MTVRAVRADELAGLRRRDPWLRWGAAFTPDDAWTDGRGVVAVRRRRRGPGHSLMVLGTAAEPVAAAVDELAVGVGGHVTVPRGMARTVHDLVGARHPELLHGRRDGEGWDWTWRDEPIAEPLRRRAHEALHAAGASFGPLAPDAAHEILELLHRASPRHSAEPGDDAVHGWYGLRIEGRLVACVADHRSLPHVPLLASVAVDPACRGRGLGLGLMTSLVEELLAGGAPAVTVDLYADNEVARNLYAGMGFVTAWRFASWWIGSGDGHPEHGAEVSA